MSEEAKKLQLIEAILRVEDRALLIEVESLLAKNIAKPAEQKSWKDFAGILSEEEADEWTKNIEEGCEQINPNDWK